VQGAVLGFDFQNARYEATTNGDGIATVSPRVKGPAGQTEVEVSFDGDGEREPTSVDAAFTVLKRNSAISFRAKRSGKKIVVKVRLFDSHSRRPLASRRVPVFVGRKKVGTIVTGADGRGKKSFVIKRPGGKRFGATFGGDGTYNAASASGRFGRSGASGRG